MNTPKQDTLSWTTIYTLLKTTNPTAKTPDNFQPKAERIKETYKHRSKKAMQSPAQRIHVREQRNQRLWRGPWCIVIGAHEGEVLVLTEKAEDVLW